MRKFAKLTALLVALAMLSTLCAFPTMADATTLTEKFVETFDYEKGTISNLSAVAPTNKYSTNAGGEIIDNPYDSSLGTSFKSGGNWYTQWSPSSGHFFKLKAAKMVASFKVGFPSENTSAGFTFGIFAKPFANGDDWSGDHKSQILQLSAAAPKTAGPRTQLGALATDTMHEFTIVVNASPDATTPVTFDLYINGVKKITGQNLYPGSKWPSNSNPLIADGIGYIFGEGSGAIIDDIRVYAATASDIVESLPANDATNVALETNSISVKFETDVTPDQMTTSNVSVSNATVSSIDRIDNKNYKINLANTLASKTEYVVSFGNAKDVLGNAITDTIKFTSFDAGFVPTKVVGPNENFENAELGSYANMGQVNTQGMFSTTGDAPFDVKANTIDSSLGKSAYFTGKGGLQTFWQKGKGMYEWYKATKAGEKIVVAFKIGSSADTPKLPTMWVEGYSSLDANDTTTTSAQVLRGGSALNMGATRPQVLSSIEKNKMYDIQYVFTTGDAGTAKCDLYIDGVYKNTQFVCAGYYSTPSPLYAISYFKLTDIEVGTWIDDIKLYTSDGMAVEETFPADGASAAKVKNFVTVKTSTPINFADTSAVALTNLGNVTRVEKVDGYTANIYFDGTVAYETTYTTKISGLKDLIGYTLTPKTITFTTGEFVPYEVGAISFTQNGTSVTANVNVTNNGTTPINPALIVAVYRGNLLVATNWVKQTVATTAPITATVSFTPEEGKTVADYSVKAYVWEDVSPTSIAPMADPTPFTLTAN